MLLGTGGRRIMLCFQWKVPTFCPSLPQVPFTMVATQPSTASHLLCPSNEPFIHIKVITLSFRPQSYVQTFTRVHIHLLESISSKNSHSLIYSKLFCLLVEFPQIIFFDWPLSHFLSSEFPSVTQRNEQSTSPKSTHLMLFLPMAQGYLRSVPNPAQD